MSKKSSDSKKKEKKENPSREALVSKLKSIWEVEEEEEEDESYDYGSESLPVSTLVESLNINTQETRGRIIFGDRLDDVIALLFDKEYSTSRNDSALFEYKVWKLLNFFDHAEALPHMSGDKCAGEVEKDIPEIGAFVSAVYKLPLWRVQELQTICAARRNELVESHQTRERSNTVPAVSSKENIVLKIDSDAGLTKSGKHKSLGKAASSGGKRVKKLLSSPIIKESRQDRSASIDDSDEHFLAGARRGTVTRRPREVFEDVEKDVPELSWAKVTSSDEKKSKMIEPSIPGFRYELGKNYDEPGWENITQDFTIENVSLDVPYYETYFHKKEHSNFIGTDASGATAVLSLETNSKEPRALLRVQKQEYKLILAPGMKSKDAIKAIRTLLPDALSPTLKLVKIKDPELDKELHSMEQKQCIKTYKFGVLYCKSGQTSENEMFCNAEGSAAFDEFLDAIGEKITLEGWTKYRGGLDVRNNATGTYSVFSTYQNYEIMFHVSTLLPFFPADPQQLERKRHLGNDVVLVVFKEGPQKFSPDCIHSEFNHVFVVVQKEEPGDDGEVRYSVEIVCKDGVPRPFRPLLPEPSIFKKSEFRQFFLSKLVNAERSAMGSPHFELKFQRTRQMLLRNLAQQFLKKT